jgi:hypothetical protein
LGSLVASSVRSVGSVRLVRPVGWLVTYCRSVGSAVGWGQSVRAVGSVRQWVGESVRWVVEADR